MPRSKTDESSHNTVEHVLGIEASRSRLPSRSGMRIACSRQAIGSEVLS